MGSIGLCESREMLVSDIVGSVWWEAISRTDRVGSDESVVCGGTRRSYDCVGWLIASKTHSPLPLHYVTLRYVQLRQLSCEGCLYLFDHSLFTDTLPLIYGYRIRLVVP